jgi:monovalent cation:H+ antiporter, CPA1 family
MGNINIEQIELIILIGALVAMITGRLKIPYTVGLVVAGFLTAYVPYQFNIVFSKDLLFNVLLPPLIFEAALYIRWSELRRDLVLISTYATMGVLLSAAVTTLIMHYFAGWGIPQSILFGVLIAATDPVSVIATFKEAKVTGRLRLLVESESLFNDGTAAVAFAVALAFAAGQSTGFAGSVWMAIMSIFGGIGSGFVVGGLAYLIIGRTGDHLVELAMTTVAAFGSFWLAEHFHLSGIMASTTAGLLVGNLTAFGTLSQKGEESVSTFWDFAAFVVNSIIFLIIGLNAAYQNFRNAFLPIGVAIVAVLVGRVVAVYPCSAIFARTHLRVKSAHQHILFWGGLRGALALALAYSVPPELPYRAELMSVTFGVVAFSVFAQGLTIPALLRKLKQVGQTEETDLAPASVA